MCALGYLLAAALAAVAAAAAAPSAAPPACAFAETASTLLVTCPEVTVSLSRANGALTGIFTSSGSRVSAGSRNECLYGSSGPNATFCGPCGCDAASLSTAYAWTPSSGAADGGVLTLTFTPSPAPGGGWGAVVTLTTRPAAGGVFDLSLRMTSAPTSGAGYASLLFPCELLLDAGSGADALTALHLPLAPGVALTRAFFAAGQPAAWSYPSSFAFASWAQADYSVNGSLAVHDLSGPDAIVPVQSRLALAGGQTSATTWYLSAASPVNISVGCSPSDAPGAGAPCAVGVAGVVTRRFVVSAAPADALAAIRAYSVANGMLAAAGGSAAPQWPSPPYASLRSKLAAAAGADFWRQAHAAPLFKFDASGLGLPFRAYITDVLPALPPPALIHMCGYEQCGAPGTPGFDCGYPDMLPPATVFGSTCDMQALWLAAAAAGHLSMPYTNPTWWDLQSPTLQNLTRRDGSIDAAAALNASNMPYMESYDAGTRSGAVMSPAAPFVRARLDALLSRLSWNTSAGPGPSGAACTEGAASLPSTYIFQDQVGARYPDVDYSPHAGGRGAAGYAAALQGLAAAYAGVGLHTEQGYDRMARAHLGFHGSMLLDVLGAAPPLPPMWAPGAWRVAPLFAASGLRAVVMAHQHNLAPLAMARDEALLCFSLATGTHLSLDLGNAAALANASWIETVAAFQRVAAARYADSTATAFGGGGGTLTTVFGAAAGDAPPLDPAYSRTYNVTWASDGGAPALRRAARPPPRVRGRGGALSTLAPGGCAVAGADGDMAAGFFEGVYNGAPLAPGVHAVLEDATCDTLAGAAGFALCVLHTAGADTPLTVALPAHLADAPALRVVAVAVRGVPIADVPFARAADGSSVSFNASALVAGARVQLFAVTANSTMQ